MWFDDAVGLKKMLIYSDASVNHFDSMIRVVVTKEIDGRIIRIANKQKSFPNNVKIAKLEFLGIFWALKLAKRHSIIYSDSDQAVKTINKIIPGDWIDEDLLKEAINLKGCKKCEIIWIPREKNLAGIDLEKRLNSMTFDPVFKRNVKKFGINKASYKIRPKRF